MRKIISVFLALVLLLSLAACPKTQPEVATTSSTVPGYEENVFGGDSTDTTTAPTQAPTTAPTTEPTQTTQATQPTQGQTATTPSTQNPGTETPTPPAGDTTPTLADEYEAYLNMSAAEKTAFRSSVADTDAFFAWYNAALKAHQEANAPIPIPPDGNIDLS